MPTPREQLRLRRALLDGDIKSVHALLRPAVPQGGWFSCGSWRQWLVRSKASGAKKAPASLDYMYEDDQGSPAIAYLLAGTLVGLAQLPGSSRAPASYAYNPDHAAVTAGRRLVVLRWLLHPEQSDLWPDLHLDRVTHRSQTVLHCCLMNGANNELLLELLGWWLQRQQEQQEQERLWRQKQQLKLPQSMHDPGGGTTVGPSASSESIRVPTSTAASRSASPDPAAGLPATQDQHEPMQLAAVTEPEQTDAAPQVLGQAAAALELEALPTATAPMVPLLSDVLRVKDWEDRCVLSYAMLGGEWRTAQLFIAAGALQDWELLKDTEQRMAPHFQPPQADVSRVRGLQDMLLALLPPAPTGLLSAARQLPAALGTITSLFRSYTWNSTQHAHLEEAEKHVTQARDAAGSSATVCVMGAQDLVEALQAAVQQVCTSLNVDEATAVSILSSHNYDLDVVLQQHVAASAQTDLAGPTQPHLPDIATPALGPASTPVIDDVMVEAPAAVAGSSDESPGELRPLAKTQPGEVVGGTGVVTGEEMEVAGISQSGRRLDSVNQQAYRPQSSGQAGGAEGSSGQTAQAGPQARRCVVCWEEEAPSLRFSVDLPCGHSTCDTCWTGVLGAQLQDGTPWRAACPVVGCGVPLPHRPALRLLPLSAHAKYHGLMGSHYVSQHPRVVWCPRPGCGHSVQLGGGAGGGAGAEQQTAVAGGSRSTGSMTGNSARLPGDVQAALLTGRGLSVQCACGQRFCFRCSGPAHEPASCADVEQFSERLRRWHAAGAAATQEYLSTCTRKCVKCRAPTQRTEGCNHMVCSQCRAHWCWACGQDWALHGRHTGGYYNCDLTPRPAADAASGPLHARDNASLADALERQVARFAAHRALCRRAGVLLGRLAWCSEQLSEAIDLTGQLQASTLSAPTADNAGNNTLRAMVSYGPDNAAQQTLSIVTRGRRAAASTGALPTVRAASAAVGRERGYTPSQPVATRHSSLVPDQKLVPKAVDEAPGIASELLGPWAVAGSAVFRQRLERWLRVVCETSVVQAWGHVRLAALTPASPNWIYLHRKLSQQQAVLQALMAPLEQLPQATRVMEQAVQRQRQAHAVQLAPDQRASSFAFSFLAPSITRLLGTTSNHQEQQQQPAAPEQLEMPWEGQGEVSDQLSAAAAEPPAGTFGMTPTGAVGVDLMQHLAYTVCLALYHQEELDRLMNEAETVSHMITHVARLGHMDHAGLPEAGAAAKGPASAGGSGPLSHYRPGDAVGVLDLVRGAVGAARTAYCLASAVGRVMNWGRPRA